MTKQIKSLSNLDDWLDLLDNPDPMDAIDEARNALRQAAKQKMMTNYESIGFIAECLRKVAEDAEYAIALKSSKVFLNDYSGPRKASVLIARYILAEDQVSGAGYEKARSYGQLADFFAQTDRDAHQIARHLDRYGIRNSLEHFSKFERKATEQRGATDEPSDRGDQGRCKSPAAPNLPERGEVEGTPPPRPLSRQEIAELALAQEPSSVPSRPKLNINTMLVLDATADFLAQMFKLEIGEGATITVHRERNNEGQDWYQFVVDDIADL